MAEDLRSYTCDALAGVELHASYAAQREAQRRVGASRLVFTTCIGAGLGLLRKQAFAIVVVDEASQQTEPAALVPLVKGCRRAILVGDHVQLRPTVRPLAAALGYDVSLFERLYTTKQTVAGMCRVMLDTQYRMHPALARFSAEAFYEGRLQTGLRPESRPMAPSAFPWPSEDAARAVFIECTAREDLGGKSKKNPGQAALCRTVCTLLCTPAAPTVPSSSGSSAPPPAPGHSIVVLTPYTGQMTLLRTALAGLAGNIEVASVDGFQGREADVVVFVTVRCNERGETGFLKDLRRLNVALTRARAGLVVLGHRRTLTMRRADGRGGAGDDDGVVEDASAVVWGRLLGGLREVTVEDP